MAVACVSVAMGQPATGAAEAELPGPAEQQVDFERDVQPILVRHCLDCHGPDVQESNLRLDRPAGLLRGGDSGEPAIVPGDSARSHLVHLVAGQQPDRLMPPDDDPLPAEQIGILRAWIDQGAPWPGAEDQPDEEGLASDLWSLQPVADVRPPPLRSPWITNPIDAFVLEKLHQAELEPSPEADRRRRIRRLYFNMLGLPPEPEQTEQFVADRREDAWGRLVDRVLANPHYGQRWARHWLDVVRFAETDGFEMNQERPHAWRYRDYVIGAFNQDKPYDQFVFEQLAGDAVGADAATGFLVGGAYDKVKSPDMGLTLMQRQDELDDMINTTGTALLGLTLGCARCHNHKFDPVLQKDYFALQAVLAGVRHGDRPLEAQTDSSRQQQLAEVARRMQALETELADLGVQPPLNPRENVERFEPLTARFVRFTVLATNSGTEPCLDELEVFTATAGEGTTPHNVALASAGARATASGTLPGFDIHRLEHVHDGQYGNQRSWISNEPGRGWVQIELAEPARIGRIVWGRDRDGNYTDRLPTQYVIEVALEPDQWQTVAGRQDPAEALAGDSRDGATREQDGEQDAAGIAAIQSELDALKQRHKELSAPPLVYAGRFEQPGPVKRLFRGDPMSPREEVQPDALTVLGSLGLDADAPERERRVALAQWITRPDHPLTARVMANRVWHYHFGRGIVETPSDFGRMGFQPTHPELLDWLAGELVRSGWSVKHLQRLILTSSTWRQSAAPNRQGLAADADTRLLWRFPPRRLEAEAIRDSMLAVSGVLDRRMGGPGFSTFEPNSNYVRVYLPKKELGPAEWRRMVYMTKVRMENDAVFGAFDCPDAGQVAPRRSQSTTALQALNLFNSGFVVQQAGLFAERLREEAGDQPDAQVRRAFWLAFGRDPHPAEASAAAQLIAGHGLAAFCRAVLNSNEFLFVP